jgi:phenylacetate-CoA ligase
MIKNIYSKSPVFIQNIFVTLENIFVLYKKYNYIPFFNSMDKIVEKVKKLDIDYEENNLIRELNDFLKYSKKYTIYYNENIPNNFKLSNLSDIQKLKILNKLVLRKNTKDFYSSEINKSNSRALFTSGSTGSPLAIKVAVKDLQLRFNILLKTMINFGYDHKEAIGRVTGHDIADENVVYRKDYLNNQYFLSAFHISEKTIHKYYEAIVNNKIKALDGYPSAIYTLAKLFEQHNFKITTIKTIYTTAEKLHDYQKEQIEKIFNCRVFDYYGSNEQSIFIYTCKNGHLHVSNKTGILEVLNEKFQPIENGQSGKMIVTSLTSHFMPLIRYDIGDSCIVSKNQNCDCGNTGLIIDEIIGRDEDIFQTIDGTYITRFSVVLKYLPKNIIESQLVLSNKNMTAKIFYTANKIIDKSLFIKYEEALTKKIGNKYKLENIHTEKIIKSSRGKTRAVIIEN